MEKTPTIVRASGFDVILKNRWDMRGFGRMIDEGTLVVVHERWCPVETAAGKPFCLCKPSFEEPRARRRARILA